MVVVMDSCPRRAWICGSGAPPAISQATDQPGDVILQPGGDLGLAVLPTRFHALLIRIVRLRRSTSLTHMAVTSPYRRPVPAVTWMISAAEYP